MRHGSYQLLTFVGLELGDLLGDFMGDLLGACEGLDGGASVGVYIVLIRIM